MAKQDLPQAEAAFKKMVELKPDSAEGYTGLAGVYNAQKKFDLAAEASAKASQLSGGGGAGGGGAEASYNQGVILFNAGKFAEAKTQFEAATKADPNMAHGAVPARDDGAQSGTDSRGDRRARGIPEGRAERPQGR